MGHQSVNVVLPGDFLMSGYEPGEFLCMSRMGNNVNGGLKE